LTDYANPKIPKQDNTVKWSSRSNRKNPYRYWPYHWLSCISSIIKLDV